MTTGLTFLIVVAALPDANLLLNVVTLILAAGAIAAAVPFVRARRQTATIATLEADNSALRGRCETLGHERDQAERNAEHEHSLRRDAEKEAAACQAAYDTLKQFTAEPALRRLEQMLVTQGEQQLQKLGRIESLLAAVFTRGEIQDDPLPPDPSA